MVAQRLIDWFKAAEINVWFDEDALSHGVAVGNSLAGQMSLCQGFVLLASTTSLKSNWVQQEIAIAMDQAINEPSFTMTIIRVDDVDIRQASPSLASLKWIEPRAIGSFPDPASIVQVVNSIFGRRPVSVSENATDIYVSRSDKIPQETNVSNAHCRSIVGLPGVRLVGDSLDQNTFDIVRIRRLMNSCSGHILILPHRATEDNYKYFVREKKVSQILGLPILVIARNDSPLPAELKKSVYYLETMGDKLPENCADVFGAFLDDAKAIRVKYEPAVFFAHEYKLNNERNKAAAELISAVTGCRCRVGLDFTGAFGTRQIIDGILRSSWFLADFASRVDEGTGGIKLNTNTCIEAGVALGAGFGMSADQTEIDRTIYAVCRESTPGYGKTTDLPFMLHTSLTVDFYKDDLEFLAKIHRIARYQRRRIINNEIV